MSIQETERVSALQRKVRDLTKRVEELEKALRARQPERKK